MIAVCLVSIRSLVLCNAFVGNRPFMRHGMIGAPPSVDAERTLSSSYISTAPDAR